jgi:hypothetical protein
LSITNHVSGAGDSKAPLIVTALWTMSLPIACPFVLIRLI